MAGLLVAEAFLRWAGLGDARGDPALLIAWTPHHPVRRDRDPEIGVSLEPWFEGALVYHDVRSRAEVLRASVAVSAQGTRGAAVTEEPAPGVRRIVFVGDSIVFGQGVADRDTLPAAFGRRVGRKWEVVNAGVPGWGTAQQSRWIATRAAGLRPSLVVVGFYMNDLVDTLVPPGARPFADRNTFFVAAPGTGRSHLLNLARRALSSGAPRSYHGDLLPTWDEERVGRVMRGLRDACSAIATPCVLAVLPFFDGPDDHVARQLLARVAGAAATARLDVVSIDRSVSALSPSVRRIAVADPHPSVKAHETMAFALEASLRGRLAVYSSQTPSP